MAIFAAGDTVAVETPEQTYTYGHLLKCGYSMEEWIIEFDGREYAVDPARVREDEREEDELDDCDRSAPSDLKPIGI